MTDSQNQPEDATPATDEAGKSPPPDPSDVDEGVASSDSEPPAEAGPRSPDAPAGAEPGASGAPAEPAASSDPAASSGSPASPEASTTASGAPDLSSADAPPQSSANVLEVHGLNWGAIASAVANPITGDRAEQVIARMEERVAGGGPLGLAFEEYAAGPEDRAIQVGENWPVGEVWFVGDLHGDLLALESALQHIDRSGGGSDARIVFLGDLFDDGVHAAEVVLRIFELILEGPMRVTVIAGNHDEGLTFGDGRFQSSVIPSDFTDWLNAQSDSGHPWAARLGKLIVRFFARAPRALFFPDGLLVAHGGIPHTDLHAELAEKRDWNDPRVLQDFVWLRAHPRARKRIPNRTTRGSEFGREDFAAFCELATRLGRPVSRMLRGHDHVEERFADFPAWSAHPALTINTLSHKLPREVFGPYERVPVVARWVRGELPEVRRLFIPPELIRQVYPEPAGPEAGA
ncbi:MAG TPA: metallophosphoesterase [Longimicrobium sp.]|uniref:metallophosphoesterase family protein n=1 Tax=Longimicrobium sp. TaxID=2029185 RepID=UPI002ED87A05